MPGLPPQLVQLLPILVLFGIMYFLMIRPQQQQQKKRNEMLNAMKKGDRIVTIGGIHGTITEIDEKTVVVRIAEKVEVKLNRSGIGGVLRND